MLNAYLFYLSIAGFAGLLFWEVYRIRRALENIASMRYDVVNVASAFKRGSEIVEYVGREVVKALRN